VSEERRAARPDEARSIRPAHDRSVALGLLPAPDIPEKIAQDLATRLPELLSRRVDDRVYWDV
jgi:hypothetical protein